MKYFTGIKVVGEILGIVGGVIGKKLGGALVIGGGVVALIGVGLFGILPFIWLLVLGIIELREKVLVKTG